MVRAPSQHLPPETADKARSDAYARMTRIAFWLLVAIVVSRVTMQEILRDPTDPSQTVAAQSAPRAPGPATSLFLDLLGCVPAFLILTRRILDKSYVVRFGWSHVVLAALGLWMALSVAWAGDRFAAMIEAANWIAAFITIWSFTQLVRSWARLRLVAGVLLGILLIYLGRGLEYRLVDVPAMQQDWREHKDERLREQNIEPGTFAAEQFERKLLAGDVGCFVNSPNTFAAALVLMELVAVGIAIQRVANRDRIGWLIPLLIALPPYVFVFYRTGSRTGIGLGALAIAMLGVIALVRHRLPALSRRLYWAGVAALTALVLAVVGHGLRHQSLGDKSLTFRWYYWTGAAKIFAQHPLHGIGWGNFGENYLAVRGPAAVEEVKDPHNFLMRAFAELGAVGGVLMIAWMLRLWWELTRPVAPPEGPPEATPKGRSLLPLAMICAGIMLLGLILSTDWLHISDWIAMQAIRYLVAALLLLIGIVVGAMRSLSDEQMEDRPAPWVLYAMLVGLGMFLLHNLVDLAVSETAVLFFFATVLGSVLGARQPSLAGRKRQTGVAAGALVAGLLLWFAAIFVVWVPTLRAESSAAEADSALRSGRPDLAAQLYEAAREAQPLNGDYAFRAADALIRQDASPRYIRGRMASAIEANPNAVKYHLLSAGFELRQHPPDRRAIEHAFEAALRLDPRSVRIRLEYATALAALGDPKAAHAEYSRALRCWDQMPVDEPRRLALEKELADALKRIGSLSPTTKP